MTQPVPPASEAGTQAIANGDATIMPTDASAAAHAAVAAPPATPPATPPPATPPAREFKPAPGMEQFLEPPAAAPAAPSLAEHMTEFWSKVREHQAPPTTAAPATPPDPWERLANDPEATPRERELALAHLNYVRGTEQRVAEMDKKIGEVTTKLSEADVVTQQQQLAQEEEAFQGKYDFSADEMKALGKAWGKAVQVDQRYANLSFGEFARRALGEDAVEARRKNGSAPPVPGHKPSEPTPPAKPTGQIVAESAVGAPPADQRWTPPQRPGGASLEDARQAAYARFAK